ncbi:hypothetical protein [Brevibacillus laterosporus]|uniref:hypothetical protein n=1 Tax=Brevibacillus laterosporus TaxID=1465 RepID=UPI000CE38C72|nr:hypothetical protein [Brevibacillus laterosporus]MED1663242.1 hypothetical protein [Brevibacillus laterosporus]MED1669441.1 hypothetical protein [Brevibacillus laterosporus]MED1717721.1 hypothetical protein [Brevibacillus laterosporus]PPA84474.1 hypothetical protein C4A76_17685 [Brevibacillus laterosporus]
MKKTRLVLWGLEPRLTLDEVKDKLSKDYTDIIHDLFQVDRPFEERTYRHKWEMYSDSFREVMINDKKIKYIFAKGTIERDRVPKDCRVDRHGELLLKSNRVKVEEIETLFFEFYGRVHVVLATPKSLDSRIRTILFYKQFDWGKIDFDKQLNQFNFESNFFNWLIYRKGQTIFDSLGNSLDLLEVSEFSGETNRGSNEFTGKGGNISRQPATQTMISMSSNFTKLLLTLKYKEICFHFKLSRLAECEIDDDKTFKKDAQGNFTSVNVHETIIKIYHEIIPLLKSAFNKDLIDGSFNLQYQYFKKESGLCVIEDIIRQLDIRLEEISELECFRK